jgi:hypothetical protein
MCAGVVERVTRRRLAEAPPRVIKASCNGTECNLNSKHQVKRSARRQPHPPIEKCETKCDPDVVDRTMQFDVVQSRCDSKQHLDVTDGALRPHTLQILCISCTLRGSPSTALTPHPVPVHLLSTNKTICFLTNKTVCFRKQIVLLP